MDGVFMMVVAIVAISVGANLIHKWLKLRHEAVPESHTQTEIDMLEVEINKMSERITKLETVILDRDETLSRKIDALR